MEKKCGIFSGAVKAYKDSLQQAGQADLNFRMYFEPEAGINSAREFTDALMAWANQEKKDLTILEESMEPRVQVDGKEYICRLADPDLQRQKLLKTGYTHSVGGFLGYKWVYLYEI